jgi:hypothetical protein
MPIAIALVGASTRRERPMSTDHPVTDLVTRAKNGDNQAWTR